ncbi:MAG: Uma2 family endonuclease [Microcystaceae cyanobacterium]
MTAFPQANPNLTFPDSDGKPMADNTEQYRWIVIIKENLEILFANDPQVFVAGDLLWYPVRSRLISPTAPDVMVVFGRPKGKRSSYRQWMEDNIAPQVVFEIRSPSNSDEELERKLEFYENYGVEEYYLYDPDSYLLQGWWRRQQLTQIDPIEDWVSPRLGIRLETRQGELEIYRPDGQRFLTSVELFQRAEQERQRAEQLADYLRSLGIDPDNLP